VLREKERGSVGVDLIVHSICKLLGHLGSQPEYGRGVQGFPEHMKALVEKAEEVGNTDEEDLQHLQSCLNVRFSRQVGSRYFVTSRNAGRAFFLVPYAVDYIQSLQLTKELNNLEKDVLTYLTTSHELAQLKVDGLFFDKVYADLMMLMKSNDLGKKYLDMNPHMKELLDFLTELSHHPRLCLDPDYKVFGTESRLYGDNKKVNHRNHPNYTCVRKRLYQHDDYDEEYTFPLVQRAAEHMAETLTSYKADQLPGGKLWSANDRVKKALADVTPTNDLCEGILGLNDWLQKVTPNLSQRTVSTMVEVLRNSTMPWFLQQDKETKDKIINLARRRSKKEKEDDRTLGEQRRLKRKRATEVEVEKGKVRQIKRMKKQELEETEQVTTVEAVEYSLAQALGRTAKQQETSRVDILRKQLQLWQPGRRVTVSLHGKKSSSEELLRELVKLIEDAETSNRERLEALLVEGKAIKHKLRDEETNIEEWYAGVVHAVHGNTVCVAYEGYTDTFEWRIEDISDDFRNRDLIIE